LPGEHAIGAGFGSSRPAGPAVSLDDRPPWRADLAAIVQHGAALGVFRPRGSVEDFTVRFCALLDGLAILRLRQAPGGTRKRLIQLATEAARAELAP
jgi:hypothetical protein